MPPALPGDCYFVRLPAQCAADHLLAEQLGSEGADANDVGDRVRVPPLRQHRNGDDAADALAEPAGLADRVHDLAQQLGVRDRLRGRASAFARGFLALELFDLRSGEFSEPRIERITGLDLLAVDEQRVRLGQPVAVVILKIAVGVVLPVWFLRVCDSGLR